MFAQKWREYWGLASDPFACEDADKDIILSEIDIGAVHSGFDRIFGDPRAPSPGIVFGEKGSGKSGLRRMMRRRIATYNERHPDARVFDIEYIDFNGYIDEVAKSVGAPSGEGHTAPGVIGQWEIADHLDGILSLGVTKLVDEVLDGENVAAAAQLSRKQALDAQILTALYYRSKRRTVGEAVQQLRSRIRNAPNTFFVTFERVLVTIVGVGIALVPFVATDVEVLADVQLLTEARDTLIGLGLGVAVLPWALAWVKKLGAKSRARKASKSVRVLPADSAPLAELLATLSSKQRAEHVVPTDTSETSRYELLQRFLGLLDALGYKGLYVLMDRVDEPTLLSDNDQWMREFVARILDIKLLQHPDLALKLFLPIEMEPLWRNASPEQLKRMRLDKSNLIEELKWTGRELYEIANQRFEACLEPEARANSLNDLFGADLSTDHVLDTLNALGTPRYAFGFLSEVFQQHVKDLPNDLGEASSEWRLPRGSFEVVRAGWIDKAGLLRRTLN